MSEESPGAEETAPTDQYEGSFQAPNSPDFPFRVMHLDSVLYDLTDPSPLVHLLEAESPYRLLVIPLALPDAIALQHAHGAIESRRPGTHELMTTILTRLQAEVIAARIVRYDGGIF
jgi:bifunctional DNase/RNase